MRRISNALRRKRDAFFHYRRCVNEHTDLRRMNTQDARQPRILEKARERRRRVAG